MNIEEVILLGEGFEKAEVSLFSQFTWELVAWVVGLVVLGIVLAVWGGIKDSEIIGEMLSPVPFLLAAFLFAFLCLGGLFAEDEVYLAEVQKWKDEVAYPYIESIPKVQKEIVYIKIDPELSHDVNGFLFLTGSVSSKEVNRTPIVVSYKDDGIVTRTDWIPTKMELTDDVKPFIEYQVLEMDLGHGIEAGLYNPQVFLPESYTFTDIK